MSERITKNMARNIFYVGSAISIIIFIALIINTVHQIPKLSNAKEMTPSVVRGKHIWEVNDCAGCHTLEGEGAFYAPELCDAFQRDGGGNVAAFKAYLASWMAAQPIKADNRKMPQFNLTKKQVNDLADFLIWTSHIHDHDWPHNIQG